MMNSIYLISNNTDTYLNVKIGLVYLQYIRCPRPTGPWALCPAGTRTLLLMLSNV